MCKNKFELHPHQIKSCKLYKCSDCGWKFKNRTELNRHLKFQKQIWCDDCQQTSCNSMQWTQHINSHKKVPDYLNICGLNQLIQARTGYENYDGYQKILLEKASDIRNKETKSLYKYIINKQLIMLNLTTFAKNWLKSTILKTNAFKSNIGFGFILYDINTEDFEYFYSANFKYFCSGNSLLFQNAVTINNFKDLTLCMNKIINLDLTTNYYLKKPFSGFIH